MKAYRRILAAAELALAVKIGELKKLDESWDTTPLISARHVPVVLSQIDDLRKTIGKCNAAIVRQESIVVIQLIKSIAVVDGRLGCQACDWSYPVPEAARIIQCHHVVPVSEGGDNEPDNLVLICANCHARAHLITEKLGEAAPRRNTELIALLRGDPLMDLTSEELALGSGAS